LKLPRIVPQHHTYIFYPRVLFAMSSPAGGLRPTWIAHGVTVAHSWSTKKKLNKAPLEMHLKSFSDAHDRSQYFVILKYRTARRCSRAYGRFWYSGCAIFVTSHNHLLHRSNFFRCTVLCFTAMTEVVYTFRECSE
jgi:hypothetical protein